MIPITLILLSIFAVQSQSEIAKIDKDCLKCICEANTGCTKISECFEDTNNEIRCGMFLLKEIQWNQVVKSPIRLRHSNISSFKECYSNYECSSDLVNAYTIIGFISNDYNLNKIKCADVAIYNQFGDFNFKRTDQYSAVLKTHKCMNKTLTNFQSKLIIHKDVLDKHLNKKKLNVSIVPRRCFDCIRTANKYNAENSNKQCSHPLQKCGPYAINFEYFLKANGNEVTKNILSVYNESSKFENSNQLLDTIDLLIKFTNADNSKKFRNENELKMGESDLRIDYNQILDQLLNSSVIRSINQYSRHKRRKNSKFLKRLIQSSKNRRNSKFKKENNEQNTKILNQSFKKLIESSSYQNFANCAIDLMCSEQLINIYVKQHLVDCNLDSTIDCDDFASIHWLGNKCTFLKQNTMLYSNVWKNFEYCSILADDVRKEEIIKNNKNFYNYDLPNFQVRPNNYTNTPSQFANQYHSINFVDLSTECLQCICEASSDNYNCTQILANHYSSSYYSSAFVQPKPPRIVYLKTNNRLPKTGLIDEIDEKKSIYNPFSITKLQFLESMISTYWYKGAAGDWERCAESIECSIETVSKFVTIFSTDCTKDGRLSCPDFGLIHRFKDKCTDLSVLNTDYYRKFERCLLKHNLH